MLAVERLLRARERKALREAQRLAASKVKMRALNEYKQAVLTYIEQKKTREMVEGYENGEGIIREVGKIDNSNKNNKNNTNVLSTNKGNNDDEEEEEKYLLSSVRELEQLESEVDYYNEDKEDVHIIRQFEAALPLFSTTSSISSASNVSDI